MDSEVLKRKKDISFHEKRINQLEKEIEVIQNNCRHEKWAPGCHGLDFYEEICVDCLKEKYV